MSAWAEWATPSVTSGYLAGNSYEAIAKLFNAEQVPYAGLKTKHRRKGWGSITVCAMIHNLAYVGEWS